MGFQPAIAAALDESGVPTPAALAVPSRRYRCPDCLAPVILRAASRRARAHFAHHANGCARGESLLHFEACESLAGAMRDGHIQRLKVRCRGCGRLLEEPLPRFEHVCRELGLDSGSRPDLVLLEFGAPVMAIEVVHSHALDTRAMDRLGELPWAEVAAAKHWPAVLIPLRCRWPVICGRCTQVISSRQVEHGESCWNCGHELAHHASACHHCGAG